MDTVRCPSCGEENPARFRLCGICGSSLFLPAVVSVTCPACGEENPARFRICGICGSWLRGTPVAGDPGGGPGGWSLPPWGYQPPAWAWYAPGPAGGGPYPQPAYGPPGYPSAQGYPPATGYGTGPGYAAYGAPGWQPNAGPQPGYPVQPGYPPQGASVAPPQPYGAPPPGWSPQPAYLPPGSGVPPDGPQVPPVGTGAPASPAPDGAAHPPPAPGRPPSAVPSAIAGGPPPPPPPPGAANGSHGGTVPGPGPVQMPPPRPQPSPAVPSPAAAPPPVPEAPARPMASGPVEAPGSPPGGAEPAPDAEEPRPSAQPMALPSQEVRKVVTIIFSDLKGSTALTEQIDAEAINEVKERYFATMAAEIERHGGKIEKYIGDAIMAVFGLPRAHEDDALRAVRAARGMVVALERLNQELLQFYGVEIANRTGVNTGEVVANTDPGAEQRLATGDAVNVAARLEQAAPANEVLIGDLTYSLVRSQVEVEAVEPLELKGKAERVAAYRLISVRDAAAVAEKGARESPLVGRDEQIGQLHDALTETATLGGCRMVTVVGDAGVGKSHLVDTFTTEVDERATVLRGRCLPYGDGITFWPLIEIARAAASIVDDDPPDRALEKLAEPIEGAAGQPEILERLASVIGLSTTAFPVTEVFWAARKYLEALAMRRPVVVIVEDAHNGEETFLDLLEHLLDNTSKQASLLVVATGRLGLIEKRPEWGSKAGTTQVSMPPLAGDDTGRLVEVLLGGAVDEAVTTRIVGSAEGNPLFVSQLVSLLVDKGLVHRDGDAWVAVGDLKAVEVPPTIQALLASRLDDLSREERAVMEPAAVIGLSFPQPAVTELVPEPLRPWVPAHLRSLDRKQFVDLASGSTADDEVYRFRNIMIRDATYGTLLKRARAQMHERFVTWAERVNRERGREEEFEEILGYHLEQAYRYRTELGPLDAAGREMGLRAATRLGNAGRRAFARSDIPAAITLLRRSADLLPTDAVQRVELLADLAEAHIAQGGLEAAGDVLDGAAAEAAALADPRAAARVGVTRLLLDLYAPSGDASASDHIAEARRLISVLEPYSDDAGLARAWRIVMANQFTLGSLAEAAEAADRVVEHAVRAGDQRMAGRSASAVAYLMVHGPTPVAEAIARCEELFEGLRGDRKNEAIVLAALAQLQAMQGRFDEARTTYRRARTILVELEATLEASATSIESSRVELLAGDLEAAERELRRDDEALAALDEAYFRSTVAGILANVLVERGDVEEAVRYSELAERLADADDTWSQAAWRTARAGVLVRRSEFEDAGRLADEAVAMVRAGDDQALRAEVLVTGADILAGAGRVSEAADWLGEALALYETKGDSVSAARVRERLGAITGAGTG